MKLSDRTLQLLKNYSVINPSIILFEGSELKTQSAQKNVFVKAKIAESFPVDVPLFDLSRFLSTLSLFSDPDLVFESKSVSIKDEKREVRYLYAAPLMLKGIPNKEKSLYLKDLKDPFASLKVSQTDLSAVLKALAVLQIEDLVFEGDGQKVFMKATNIKNPTSDSFQVEIGESSMKFQTVFKQETFKLIAGDYIINVFKNVGHFQTGEVEYFIAGNI